MKQFDRQKEHEILFPITKEPNKILKRFRALFIGAPTEGGFEWRSLQIWELVDLLKQSAKEITQIHKQNRDKEIEEHSRLSWWKKWQKKKQGWKTPPIVLESEIIRRIVELCYYFANWIDENYLRQNTNRDKLFLLMNLVTQPRKVAFTLKKD